MKKEFYDVYACRSRGMHCIGSGLTLFQAYKNIRDHIIAFGDDPSDIVAYEVRRGS